MLPSLTDKKRVVASRLRESPGSGCLRNPHPARAHCAEPDEARLRLDPSSKHHGEQEADGRAHVLHDGVVFDIIREARLAPRSHVLRNLRAPGEVLNAVGVGFRELEEVEHREDPPKSRRNTEGLKEENLAIIQSRLGNRLVRDATRRRVLNPSGRLDGVRRFDGPVRRRVDGSMAFDG